MTTAWVLNAIGLFVTTVGALLTFLYVYQSPRFVDQISSAEGKAAFAKHQRLLSWVIGLLATWLVVQCLAIILI